MRLKGSIHAAKRTALYQSASTSINSLVNDDRPVLHMEDNADIIALLVRLGVDVNSSDQYGNTALHCSGTKQPYNLQGFARAVSEVARIVTATKDCDVDLINHEGTNAARIAMRVNEPMVTGIIAEHMKHFDAQTLFDVVESYGFHSVVQALIKLPDFDLDVTNREGLTPIQFALKERSIECVKILLTHPSASAYLFLLVSLEFEEAVLCEEVKTIRAIIAKERSKGKSSGWDINCRPT